MNKMEDTTKYEKEHESFNNRDEDVNDLKSSLTDEEATLLISLMSKINKINTLRSKIEGYEKIKKDKYFGKKAHGEIIGAYEEIDMIKNEVVEILRNYLSPLNDEEKNHVAEIILQNGYKLQKGYEFAAFVIDNAEYFGEIFNKRLAEQTLKDSEMMFISNLYKFEIPDDERRKRAEKIIQAGLADDAGERQVEGINEEGDKETKGNISDELKLPEQMTAEEAKAVARKLIDKTLIDPDKLDELKLPEWMTAEEAKAVARKLIDSGGRNSYKFDKGDKSDSE